MSRNVAWHFKARWKCPDNLVATTASDPAHLQRELEQLDDELKKSVLTCERYPQNLRNVEFNYKISDWLNARTDTPIKLHVEGYIQSEPKYAKDRANLNLWFDANWSPVQNGLRKDPAYMEWAKGDPAYRHVQVFGTPGVAKAGRKRKDTAESASSAGPAVPVAAAPL
jgi:hypothetical protein